MSSNLYSIEYLEKTTQLLKEIKEKSYERFLNIEEGHIADIGCGTGQDVINLAQLIPGNVKVTGVDIEDAMIRKAEELAQGMEKVAFVKANVEELPFDHEALHGLRNERLIQHVHDPLQAFREFNRVLKPGASLVIVETDWSSISLYCGLPGMANRIKDFYANHNVANGSVALELDTLLLQTGFRDIEFNVYPLVSHSLQQVIAFTRLDYILAQMLERELLTTEEHEAWNKTLQEADQNGHFALSLNLVVATGIK
mgnify:CR=1 FL=1